MPLDGGAVIGLAVPSVGEIGYFQILNIVNNSTTNLPQACHSLAVGSKTRAKTSPSLTFLACQETLAIPPRILEGIK